MFQANLLLEYVNWKLFVSFFEIWSFQLKMINYNLTQINIYPIKSLGGISLQSSLVEERGLQYDRRWMLVDEQNKFITQRLHPKMALLTVEINNDLLTIKHKQNKLCKAFLVTIW